MEPIPLYNPKPIRLDIVLNITNSSYWGFYYRADLQNLLESTSVLGRFHPEKGCVRLSLIDVLRARVTLDRFPSDRVDWNELQKSIADIDQDAVDVHVLENRKEAAHFTEDYLRHLALDMAGCGTSTDSTPLAVAISPYIDLPAGSKLGELPPLPHNVFIYLNFGLVNTKRDGMGQILRTATPQRFDCGTPRAFRNALAKIAESITGEEPATIH